MDIPRWTDYKVSRIYGSVRRTCPQVTKRGRAEDVVQETLLPAWRYRDSPKEGAPVRPRIYRVATNVGFQASGRLRQGTRTATLFAKRELQSRFENPRHQGDGFVLA